MVENLRKFGSHPTVMKASKPEWHSRRNVVDSHLPIPGGWTWGWTAELFVTEC